MQNSIQNTTQADIPDQIADQFSEESIPLSQKPSFQNQPLPQSPLFERENHIPQKQTQFQAPLDQRPMVPYFLELLLSGKEDNELLKNYKNTQPKKKYLGQVSLNQMKAESQINNN